MKSLRISSILRDKRLFWAALCLLTALAAVLSLLVGSVKIPPDKVIAVLTGQDRLSAEARIVLFSRLPRTAASLLAGASLAVSGAIIQTVLNNPLASPSIIGVNSGAGLAVALLCAALPSAQGFAPLAAFAGAFAGVMLVVWLAQCTGASRITVVLAGVAVSNLFGAGIDAVIIFVPEALNGISDFRIGGFFGADMARIAPAGWLIAAGLILALSLSQQMDVLALGGDIAQSLGLSVKKVRLILLLTAAALAGAAVSFSGLVGFVGLIVPHAMRRLIGEESLPLTLSCALGGAFLTTACDMLARTLFAPYELPVGIVLAFAGAPFFLWLLFKQRGARI